MANKVICLLLAIICFALAGFEVKVKYLSFQNLGFALVTTSLLV